MTDAEIIKALKKLYDEAHRGYMTHLEHNGPRDTSHEEYIDLMSATLDLIQRQQGKIEKLKKKADAYDSYPMKVLVGHNTEVFSKTWEDYLDFLDGVAKEAVKEFAGNLKQDIKNHRLEMNLNGLKGTHRTDEMTYETIIEYIDNLLEEMVGESDDR